VRGGASRVPVQRRGAWQQEALLYSEDGGNRAMMVPLTIMVKQHRLEEQLRHLAKKYEVLSQVLDSEVEKLWQMNDK
jgi:hypothetical protein